MSYRERVQAWNQALHAEGRRLGDGAYFACLCSPSAEEAFRRGIVHRVPIDCSALVDGRLTSAVGISEKIASAALVADEDRPGWAALSCDQIEAIRDAQIASKEASLRSKCPRRDIPEGYYWVDGLLRDGLTVARYEGELTWTTVGRDDKWIEWEHPDYPITVIGTAIQEPEVA